MDSKSKRLKTNKKLMSKQRQKKSLVYSPCTRLSKSDTKLGKSSRNLVDLNSYRIMLNKLLNINKYEQLIQYGSRFVSKPILQCRQQPQNSQFELNHLHKIGNSLGERLMSDGIFIKHLAQVVANSVLNPKNQLNILPNKQSEQKGIQLSWKVVKNFRSNIKINKKLFNDYYSFIKQKIAPTVSENQSIKGDTDYQGEDSVIFQNQSVHSEDIYRSNTHLKQTFAQKQFRHHGFSKMKKKYDNDEQNKVRLIPFEQYMASNRKNMQQNMKQVQKRLDNSQRKKQTERVSNMLGNCHSPHAVRSKNIKRTSIRESGIIRPPIQKLNPDCLANLSIIEQQVINKFLPSIKHIGHLKVYLKNGVGNVQQQQSQLNDLSEDDLSVEQGVKIVGQIQLLGFYNNYELLHVAIQFKDCWSYGQSSGTVCDYAAMIRPKKQEQNTSKIKQIMSECQKLPAINYGIRYFVTN